MKVLKSILLYGFILNSALYAEQPMSDTAEPVSISPIKEEVKQEETKNDLTDWNNHLKQLLEKGSFWDETDKIPAQDWKTKAFDIAKEAIQKNTGLADEIKTSFSSTVNEKVTLENSNSTPAIEELITSFNNYVDELVKPQEEASNLKENLTEVPQEEEKKESSITEENATM